MNRLELRRESIKYVEKWLEAHKFDDKEFYHCQDCPCWTVRDRFEFCDLTYLERPRGNLDPTCITFETWILPLLKIISSCIKKKNDALDLYENQVETSTELGARVAELESELKSK